MGNVDLGDSSPPFIRVAAEGVAGSLTASAPDVSGDLSGP
jgi:hypothetical protein